MSNGPRLPQNENSINGIFSNLDSYWLYVVAGLVFLAGLGLVGVLGLWYVQQQAAMGPVLTPIPAGNARIFVEPPSGAPGTLLQVTGQHWQAGDVVFISLEAPFAVANRDFAHAGAVVDEMGRFKVSFPFPTDDRWSSTGAMKVVGWAEQSGAKAVTIFQVLSATPAISTALDSASTPGTERQATTQPEPNFVANSTALPFPTETPPGALPAENWHGEYFDNPTISGSAAFFRDDPDIQFDWGAEAPGENVGHDGFSVRWTRHVPFTAGVYRFFAQADDGIRLWVDDKLVLEQWHEGFPTTYVADTYLWEGQHRLRVEYYERAEEASVRLWWERLEVFPDWKGEYFDDGNLTGQPVVVRNDPQIRFSWGDKPPAQSIRADDFSVRWTRRVKFDQGRYRFYVNADGGMRVWLDSDLIVDFWQNDGTGLRTADFSLGEGEHRVKVDYYNDSGDARAELWWEMLAVTPSAPSPTSIAVPMAGNLYPPATEFPSDMQTLSSSPGLPAVTLSPGGLSEVILHVPLPTPVIVPTATLTVAFPADVPSVSQPSVGRPALQVEPPGAALGTEVIVRSEGWAPGEEVVLSLVEPGGDLDQAPPFARSLADESGRFEVKLLLPDGPRWLEYSELIILAHNTDWSSRLVSPLSVVSPASVESLQPLSAP
jgi:hypothetical protein